MTSLLKLENVLFKPAEFLSQRINLSVISLFIFISLLIRFLCIGSHDLLVEEAYYWNYSQHLDFGYLDHPPMVALLIKLATLIFGTNEFGIRIPALFCWGVAAVFMFQWTELIYKGSGQYAVFLLSFMPFYFFQSIVITPDQPVLACWTAALYYFYRIFQFDESSSWYKAGVCVGLGMLSKYTIVLLGPALLLYMITVPSARYWFARKEPYLCVLIAACLFTPVIYWNATHEWISFVFQSTRRFKSPSSFSFHYFLGLIVLFLLPNGVVGLCSLWHKKTVNAVSIDVKTRHFIQIVTLFPLAFFGIYSLNHPIKIDWIGPGLVSIIPWLSVLIVKKSKFYKTWCIGAICLIPCYTALIWIITFGSSEHASKELFQKLISWENITEQLHEVAKKVERDQHASPVLIPLDVYNIGSELAFYQAKLLEQGKIPHAYAILGRHVFGRDSLMYRYWSQGIAFSSKALILISADLKSFDFPEINERTVALSSPQKLWSVSQGSKMPVVPYYYKVVQMK